MSVLNLRLGEIGKIKEIKTDSNLLKRLKALGLVEGNRIKVVDIAPLKDPIAIQIKGSTFAIRKSDCKRIILE